jgi:hypothetical protein
MTEPKFKIDERVFPISKSTGCSYISSSAIKEAKRKGYITIDWVHKHGSNFQYMVKCGERFTEEDLIPYPISNRLAVTFLKRG